MFSLIAAIGKNRELGQKNQLVFHIKEDMRFFKETTLNHKVVMGRKTWESLPGKLKNRENIVVSREEVPGADLVISDLPAFIKKYQDSPEEIFVIGGGMIYAAFLPYAKHLYLTEIDKSAPADIYFPEFDPELFTRAILKRGQDHDLSYAFVKYTRK